jgi:WD40 repeat protein
MQNSISPFPNTFHDLLPVGFYDGAIAIYDVRGAATAEPLYMSVHGAGKHTEPVWKLRWVDRGQDRGEQLVSISTDGRVTQWALKKVRPLSSSGFRRGFSACKAGRSSEEVTMTQLAGPRKERPGCSLPSSLLC